MGFHELNTTSNHLTSSSHSHLKPARKKHSIKKWFSQRVFGNKHNKVAPTPTLPTSKQAPLFGSPLRDVCHNGQLPKSISVSFSVLFYILAFLSYRFIHVCLKNGKVTGWPPSVAKKLSSLFSMQNNLIYLLPCGNGKCIEVQNTWKLSLISVKTLIHPHTLIGSECLNISEPASSHIPLLAFAELSANLMVSFTFSTGLLCLPIQHPSVWSHFSLKHFIMKVHLMEYLPSHSNRTCQGRVHIWAFNIEK